MSGLWGLDVEAVRKLAADFDSAADELTRIESTTRNQISEAAWRGADFDDFGYRWDTELGPALRNAADRMRNAGNVARANADAQVAASEVGGSGGGDRGGDGGGGLWGWLGDRAEDLWNAGGDVVDWVGDRAGDLWDLGSDAFDFLGDRVEAVVDDWANAAEHLGHFWDATQGSILRGEMPKVTEVVASYLGFAGAFNGAMVTSLTSGMIEANIFDDGKPYAGKPQILDDVAAPHGLTDYTESLTAAYEKQKHDPSEHNIRITQVGNSYVVEIPGTQTWDPRTGANAMDLTGNLVTAGGHNSTMTRAIEMAIAEKVPAGSNVMLVGHSQGGMTAVDIAADSSFASGYNITHVVTYGSPVENTAVPARTSVLNLQHEGDLVPKLDLGGMRTPGYQDPVNRTPNVTTVTFDNPPGSGGIEDNHDHHKYTDSIRNSTDPALQNYLNDPSIQQYFVHDGESWEKSEVEVGRRDR